MDSIKNKKASTTLIFLIVSILIISSGVFITEVKNSNNKDNTLLTGPVSYNNENDDSNILSDPSGDGPKTFIFDNSERKTSPKNRNSPTSVSGNLIASETNETSLSDNQSQSESASKSTSLSDGSVFKENGTDYIMRDGVQYSVAASDQISFNPPLPSSICVLPSGVGEKIDIKIIGSLSPTLNFNGVVACLYADYVGADIELKILERDFLADDLITSKTFHVSVNCDNPKVNYSNIFKDVDFSSFFGGIEGNTIEVYGLVKLTSNQLNGLEYSTTDYNIDKANCDCLSGSCCDLSSRPYMLKPSGSQPTGYNDEYICSGTNSPTGTSYCVGRNYYCNGTSANYSYSDTTSDICGICEYCTPGDPTCNYYSSSTVCGTQDCDNLDTTCRNYNDVNKFCAGNSGTCNTASCTSYIDAQKGTSCGTGKECNGIGSCITCTSHNSYACYLTDVYWYDACGNKEEEKQNCGISYYSDWQYYCVGDDKWKKEIFFDKGCSNAACYSNTQDVSKTFVETCKYGCFSGQCKTDPNIKCYTNSDCGKDGYTGKPYCSKDDVYEDIVTYNCNNPGTATSYCSASYKDVFKQDCGTDESGANYCYDNDVYSNFTDKGCLSGACFTNTSKQKVSECGIDGCSGGSCINVDRPDLTIIDLVVQSIRGRNVTFAFTVKNIGKISTNNTYWMVDTNSSDVDPKRTVPVALAPGNWTRAYMMWTYSQSGTYKPIAIVDYDNLIMEANESNNRQSISVTV